MWLRRCREDGIIIEMLEDIDYCRLALTFDADCIVHKALGA
jgi:hypothetical protein